MVSTPAPRLYLGLEFLRGLCALSIASYHFINWSFGYDLQSLGMFGVYIFFVLSALVLMIRYEDVFGNSIRGPDLKRFYQNRGARILPLLALIAAVAYFYLEWRSGGQSAAKALLTGSGLFALQMPGYLSNTTGAWSLGIELSFYALFPVLCLLLARSSLWKIGALVILTGCAQQLAINTLPNSDDPSFWAKYTLPITFAPFFAIGIFVYRVGIRDIRYALEGSVLCLLSIAVFSWFVPIDLFRGGTAFVLLSTLSGLSVFLAYQSKLSGATAMIGRFLGKISYAVYLSHWLVFEAVFRLQNVPLRTGLYAFGVPCLGALLYFFYERPLRDIFRCKQIANS